MLHRAWNFVAFYAGWFACVMGAARGYLWLGPLATVILLAVHLGLSPDPRGESRLILGVGLLGGALDTLLSSLGLYTFGELSFLPWLCPPWMVALWMLFASTLRGSMSWLLPRPKLAAVLGAIFGPVTYLYGVGMGAISLTAPSVVSLGVLGVVWAILMPLLMRWSRPGPLPQATA